MCGAVPEVENKQYFLFIGIFGLMGAILVIFTEFAGWYSYYYGIVVSIGFPSILWGEYGGAFFFIAAICHFYSSAIGFLAYYQPEKISSKLMMDLAFWLEFLILFASLFGALGFHISMLVDPPTDWWISPACWGGGWVAGGVSVLFYHVIGINPLLKIINDYRGEVGTTPIIKKKEVSTVSKVEKPKMDSETKNKLFGMIKLRKEVDLDKASEFFNIPAKQIESLLYELAGEDRIQGKFQGNKFLIESDVNNFLDVMDDSFKKWETDQRKTG